MLRRVSTYLKDKGSKKKEDTASSPPTQRPSGGPTGPVTSKSDPQSRNPSSSITQSRTEASGTSQASPDKPPTSRSDVENKFAQFAQLIHASQRPLPNQSGDGTYIEDENHHGSLWADLKSLGLKDVKTLTEVLAQPASGGLNDDKNMLMERVIQLVAALPQNSKTRVDLTNAFVGQLWDSLEHPPQSHLGNEFRYRRADGGFNNVQFPNMGAANTPYARSVPPLTIQPAALPDPGVIFDCLFARSKFTPHPNNVSSVLFYWASIIIHDLFQTDHHDFNNSQTSSYLDLSPLYGDTQEDQDLVRTFKDGKLKPDCFSEHRLLAFPPGCGVILIMFNRFHNYVVEQLAIINEGGRFTKPSSTLPADKAEQALTKYDNDLFQTGRLITCGLYMNITLLDYLRTIVNLNRSNTTWTLDPRVDMGKGPGSIVRGVGNQVSAEFNLVYRWHSAISEKDEKWTQDVYKEMFGKPADEVSMGDLIAGLKKWASEMPQDPHQRTFHGLKRGPDGKFSDDELVSIMSDAIEDTAGSFGPNNVPKVLRAVEILGMQQARYWQLGSLNEFRKFFGLKPHETFESINSDPKVADHLRHLYEHPDFVEMYSGLIAEEAKKPMVPGVGIAPTYTISRAILSDAVVLVRGDRFYTVDYNAKNLTNWGYNEVQYDLNFEQGCVFYKLFLRAFPNHFAPDSVYAHYPMTIPKENRKILNTLGRAHQYSYQRPARIPQRINLVSYSAAKYVLEHQNQFKVTWGEGFGLCFGQHGWDFMLSGDTGLHAENRECMKSHLYRARWHQEVKQFYEHITLQLLHEKSYKLAGVNEVDITRDVGNLAHVHFASAMFALPLKTTESPHGIYTEHEMYQLMSLMFIAIFFDLDPVKSMPLRQAAKTMIGQLGKVIELNVKAMDSVLASFFGRNQKQSYLADYGKHMIKQLVESAPDHSVEVVVNSMILPTAGAMVANQAQVFTQALDFYLSDKGKKHLPEINRLAKLDTADADEKLLHYAMEGIRLNGTFGLYRRASASLTLPDGPRTIQIQPNDKVFVSFVSAARDAVMFPNPGEVDITRPLENYIHYGRGPHQCLGEDVSKVAITAMLKTVGRLDGLRRAKGPRGELKKIPRDGGFYIYMREDWGGYFPFPTTMRINWDGELPALKKPEQS